MGGKLGIVVPVYNVESYLRECVDSILNQTYDNIEVALVDDGSKDNSGKICDEYAQKDSRIIVKHTVNGGISRARNTGLDLLSNDCEYIAFVDSDDFIHPDFYKNMISVLEKSNSDISICGFDSADENGVVKEHSLKIEAGEYSPTEILRKLSNIHGWVYVTVYNKVYKKKVVDCVRFPEGKIHEDEFTIHQFLLNSDKIVCVSECYYYYRQISTSVMHTSGINHLDGVEAIYQRYKYLENRELYDLLPITMLLCNFHLRNIASVKSTNASDRKRKKESIEMYRELVRNEHSKASLKHKLIAAFPFIFFYVRKLLKK